MSEVATTSASNRKITKKKRRAKKRSHHDEHMNNALQQLKARFGRDKSDDVLLATFNTKTKEISNPTSYERIISRAVESQLNRLAQPDTPANLKECVWLCALCQNRSCWGTLGDLYGPYYITSSDLCQPPPSLAPSTMARHKKHDPLPEGSCDVWFHGQCALWASELYLIC
jgi:hypothetical protein